jgi:hypothetical protein
MFIVTGIHSGVCLACEKECECFQVECRRQGLSGLLCLPDFRKQVKIAAATGALKTPANVDVVSQ